MVQCIFFLVGQAHLAHDISSGGGLGVTDLVPGDLVPGVFCFQFGAHDLVPRRFSAWSI